jgi:hypothetical protein
MGGEPVSLGIHAPRPKSCEVCEQPFIVLRMSQKVCGPKCAIKLAKSLKAKGKRELRERKAALKRIPELIQEAQRAFNAFIRERDRGQPCICCGRSLGEGDVGGAFDAGHYRSTGSAPHLRFDERNCHAQKKACNRYGAGRAVDYRVGLIGRIGLAAVEALESDNRVHKWTREELIQIKQEYREKLKQLLAQRKEMV